MQTIANSYRGIGLVIQLGADRVIVPLAILMSLMVAAAVGYELTNGSFPASPGFF